MKQIKNLSTDFIVFGHFGNGITVFTTEKEENNDYMKLAHIDANRSITWYKAVSENIQKVVNNYAQTANPAISSSQDQLVFNTKI